MADKKKKKEYKSPYERKFGKPHPNSPKARDGTTGIGPVAPDHPRFPSYESHLKSRNEGYEAGERSAANKSSTTSTTKNTAAKVSKVAGAIADFAGSMAKHSADSFKGLNPSATNVKKGVRPYNYQPERMVPEEATSSMVRFDNEYEKEKKKMGL